MGHTRLNCLRLTSELAPWHSQPCLAVFRDLSAIARSHPEIKIITFNSEGIFTNAPIDAPAVKRFVARRDDMDYPVFIDTHRVAVNCTWCPFLVPGSRTPSWAVAASQRAGPS